MPDSRCSTPAALAAQRRWRDQAALSDRLGVSPARHAARVSRPARGVARCGLIRRGGVSSRRAVRRFGPSPASCTLERRALSHASRSRPRGFRRILAIV